MIDALTYSRESILALEGWRLISGHFVHVNMQHALVNISLYVICFYLLKPYLSIGKFVIITLMMALLTSFMLLIFTPEIKTYMGLSGVLHGCFMFAALTLMVQQRKISFLLLAFVLLKIFNDILNHGALLPGSDFIIATQAHIFGIIAGMIVYLFFNSFPAKISQGIYWR